jgi:hypothetical protein
VLVVVLVIVIDFDGGWAKEMGRLNPLMAPAVKMNKIGNNSENPVARFQKIANLCGPTQ